MSEDLTELTSIYSEEDIKIMNEIYEDVRKRSQEIFYHNQGILKHVAIMTGKPFKEINENLKGLLEFVDISSIILIVDKPKGTKQTDDDCGVFKNTHVEQWGVGYTGDSFEGYVYSEFKPNMWIKIPYSC